MDYDVVSVKSNVRMQGIFLKEGEQIGVVNAETGAKQLDLLEDERQYETTEIEEKSPPRIQTARYWMKLRNTPSNTRSSAVDSPKPSSLP